MTQRDRTLMLLQRAGSEGVSTAAFLEAYIPRFSARIEELRREGFQIARERLRQGSFKYTLTDVGGGVGQGQSHTPREVDGADPGTSSSAQTPLFHPEPVPHWHQDAA